MPVQFMTQVDDQTRLRHMLEAAEDARSFCRDMDQASFASDRRTWRAVVHCIEVIGEAARHISESTRNELSGIAWRKIVGMRHRITRVYFRVDLAIVWRVVEVDLPPLIETLRQYLARLDGHSEE